MSEEIEYKIYLYAISQSYDMAKIYKEQIEYPFDRFASVRRYQ